MIDGNTCDYCGKPFIRLQDTQRFCSGGNCRKAFSKKKLAGRLGEIPHDTADLEDTLVFTRRCANKQCLIRFVPINGNHRYHEPACAQAEDVWTLEEQLIEEGSLTPDASPLEIARRAFAQKNTMVRKFTSQASTRSYLAYEIKNFYRDNPQYCIPTSPASTPRDGDRGERVVIAQLADWQFGKLENGIGIKVMLEERIPRIKQAIRSVVERQRAAGYTVRKVIVSFGGDIIEGCFIYNGQNVTGLDKTSNTHFLTRQVRIAAIAKAEIVSDVSTYVEEVESIDVPGNHGRTNSKSEYSDPLDNLDLMCGEWSRDIIGNNPRVTVTISKDWWHSFKVLNHKVISQHGDAWNGPLQKIETLLPMWINSEIFGDEKIDLFLTHHRHSFNQFRIGNIWVSQSGTIDGGSNWYLKAFGRASKPSQTLIVSSERRVVESSWEITFD